MNSIELGKKIKEARIRRKMTQSEVVGDFITRNMLSQIESGTATPSIKTLEYLSRVLDVPLINLMPDQEEDALSILEKAKGFLAAKAYNRVIETEEGYPRQLSDEFAAIFSYAYLHLSKQALLSEDYREAARFSQKAMEYSGKGVYANPAVKAESIVVLNQAAEKLNELG